MTTQFQGILFMKMFFFQTFFSSGKCFPRPRMARLEREKLKSNMQTFHDKLKHYAIGAGKFSCKIFGKMSIN